MFIPTFFEVNSAPYVLFLFPLCHCCFIDYILLVAVILNGASVLVSPLTVAASILVISVFFFGDLVVVTLYYLLHVLTAAVRYFDSVSVKDRAQGMSFWKMCCYQVQELLTDVGGDCVIPGRVEP